MSIHRTAASSAHASIARYRRVAQWIAVAALAVLGPIGNIAAQTLTVPAPPTKQIALYNNSQSRIYAMIEVGRKRLDANTVNTDLWMQAQLGVNSSDTYKQQFPTAVNYRAYINLPTTTDAGGIPPGGSIVVDVPFYTQLKDVTADDLGVDDDQFIDWWNGVRLYFFNGANALSAAYITYDTGSGQPHPVTPLAGAAEVLCTNSAGGDCNVTLESTTINPLFNIPFQLQEYTFASAEGPPPGGLLPAGSPLAIDDSYVNYNVSSLDSVYLPIAMGPLGNASVPYLGSAQLLPAFNAELRAFSAAGNNWPFYVPTYFAAGDQPDFPPIFGAACSLAPFTTTNPPQAAYRGTKIPGTANVINLSYAGIPSSSGGEEINPPIPPTLSSQPANYETFPGYAQNQCVSDGIDPYAAPELGTAGQSVVDLWTRCTTDNSDTTPTCIDIKTVRELFISNYQAACGTNPADQPDAVATLFAAYGWVPISFPLYASKCHGGALAGSDPSNPSPQYVAANEAYCRLQYNYLTLPAAQGAYVFNPYVQLIHGTLQSSAYAFSIDDKASFRHVTGTGVVIAIGGTRGLENETPSPLPTASTIFNFCRAGQ